MGKTSGAGSAGMGAASASLHPAIRETQKKGVLPLCYTVLPHGKAGMSMIERSMHKRPPAANPEISEKIHGHWGNASC